VATYEDMVNTKRVTPRLIQRMCVRDLSAYTGYTCLGYGFVRDELRSDIVDHLGGREAVVVVDETGKLKRGGTAPG
jgi:hypothetical protein